MSHRACERSPIVVTTHGVSCTRVLTVPYRERKNGLKILRCDDRLGADACSMWAHHSRHHHRVRLSLVPKDPQATRSTCSQALLTYSSYRCWFLAQSADCASGCTDSKSTIRRISQPHDGHCLQSASFVRNDIASPAKPTIRARARPDIRQPSCGSKAEPGHFIETRGKGFHRVSNVG